MEYTQARDKVSEELRAVAATLEDARGLLAESSAFPAQLRALAARLEARFVLAVVGEFSSGKSFLLNALIGRVRFEETPSGKRIAGLLATDINPSTASITELEFARDERAVAEFTDGRSERVPLDALSRFVAVDAGGEVGRLHDATRDESGAPSRVRVFIDSPFLRAGFIVADTPGLASVNPAHRRATLAYLPGADAVLYLIDTQTPFAEGDAAFLGVVRESIETVFIVQTKIDLWRMPQGDAEAWQNAYRRIRAQAALQAPGTRVFPLSAREYAEGLLSGNPAEVERSRFPAFLHAIESSLIATTGRSRLRRAAAGASVQVRTALEQLDALETALELEPQELAGRRAGAAEAFAGVEAALAGAREGLDRDARHLQAELQRDGTELAGELIRALAQAFDVSDVARLRDRGKLHVLVDRIVSAKVTAFARTFAASLDRSLELAIERARSDLASALEGELRPHAATAGNAEISKLDAVAPAFGGNAGSGAWSGELETALRTAVVLEALAGPAVALVERIASRFAAAPDGAYMKRELIADLRAVFFPALEGDVAALAAELAGRSGHAFTNLGEALAGLVERLRAAALGGLTRAAELRLAGGEDGARARMARLREDAGGALRRIDALVAEAGRQAAMPAPDDVPMPESAGDGEPAAFDPQAYARGLRPTRWRIAVLGAIKRGKSSIINAIAGERIVADEDGIAFPVHVRYGDERRAFSLDAQGEWCEIAFGGATAAANAAPVLIEVPWKMPRELVLVHAPAFDSGDPYAEEIALAVADASHAALCLFSRQLSDRELAVFEDVARSAPEKPLLFAHTLADNEAPGERRGVVELAARYLSERGIAARRIFTVSSLDYRNALAAGRAPSAWNELGALIATIQADAEEHMARLTRRAPLAAEGTAEPSTAASLSKPTESALRQALRRIFRRR